MPRSNLEDKIHRSIGDYLRTALPRNAVDTLWHTPNGGLRNKATGAYLKRLGTKAGVGDWDFVHHGRLHELEVKTNKGSQTAEQKDRQRALIAAGARYAVVRSIDDTRDVLHEWAIPLRERDFA